MGFIREKSTNILTAVLNKLGKNYEDLSPQAKATFDRWEKTLTGEPITADKLKEFLKGENENLLNQLLDKTLKPGGELDIRLKAELEYGRLIISILESPEQAIKNLERYLRKLHNIK
jgi:hypothetical protein